MATRKPKKITTEAAIPVSYRLQFYTVVAGISAAVIQTLFYVILSGFPSFGNVSHRYMFHVLAVTSLFPLVVFLISYYSSARYTVPIGRWFIATIKTFIVMSVFGVLESLWQWLTISLYDPKHAFSGPPPAWLSGDAHTWVFIVAALAGLAYYAYRNSEQRK
jgi:hypothetical protein